ncbi:MAG: copper amine oxidase N-terminal domain-containing protein [Ruminococcaceae bacterium]|nr:copper amine oxidase N-terminal domain-containing protein [Oscillospiraceae bacterium]
MNKIIKRLSALLVVALILISAMCQVIFAEEAAPEAKMQRAEFIVSEPDENGCATASLVIYDSKFSGAQFGFSFDNTVLQLVDRETKEPSEEFNKIATLYDYKTDAGVHDFKSVGCKASNAEGTLKMAAYGMQSAVSDEGAAITIGEEGFKLFDFSVKFLKNEDPCFDVLDTLDRVYPKDAFIGDGKSQKATSLKFVFPESFNLEKEAVVYEPVLPEPSLKVLREERLVDTLMLNIGNFAAIDDGYLKVIDDGNREVVPFIEGDRTYLPLRFIGEAFGAQVNWNPDNQEITVALNDIVVVMNIGKAEYTINGEKKEMDVAPFIREDRTFVPVRYIGEALDKAVYWDGALRLVIVTANESPWNPEGKAEKDILPDALLLMSELVRDMMLPKAE